jgi:hypothetical protein
MREALQFTNQLKMRQGFGAYPTKSLVIGKVALAHRKRLINGQ